MQFRFFVIVMLAAAQSHGQVKEFKAERISKSASFTINGSIDKVFSLFGPIREKEWAAGWEPQIIYSTSQLVEEHMIFETKAKHADEEKYRWVITQFQPQDHWIEYTVSTINRVWFIHVQCEAKDRKTFVTVTYTYTGLNERGNELNSAALTTMFEHNLTDWQRAINYFLETGKQPND